jgi:hypothetical protein
VEQCPSIETDLRAVFTATVRGATEVREVVFDIGLRSSDNPAGVRDLLEAWPDLQYSETREFTALYGLPALDRAWTLVHYRISAMGYNANRVRDTGPLVPLIVNRALRGLALTGSVPPIWSDNVSGYLATLDKEYEEALAVTIPGLSWYDDTDQGTTAVPGPPPTGRVYLSR